MKRSFFSVTLLLILFAAYPYYAATKNPGCNSISTTIVKNDTFTTKINCGNWGGWEVIRTKNGILDGAREFYNLDGKLLVRDSNNNGKLEGHREEWSSDGWLEKYQSYHSGHLSDTLLVFFDHGGNLRLFSVFDTAGKKKGWSMTWADNGILLDSAYYVRNEMKEAYYFWKTGKLMLYEKTQGNAQTHRYDILEAASFDSKGKQNGEVKGGNGRIIVLKPEGDDGCDRRDFERTHGALDTMAVEGTDDALDTMAVMGTQVQADEYFGGNFSLYQKEYDYPYSSLPFYPCDSISISIVNNDTLTTTISCDRDGRWMVYRTKNGKEDGIQEKYYPFGKLASISTYKNGMRDGIHEEWSNDESLEIFESYRNDHCIDTCRQWYNTNHQVQAVFVYNTAGKENGWSMHWDESGILRGSVYYVNGEKKEGFFFWDSGKLMLYEKTNWNIRTGHYVILEAATFDSTGKQNGKVNGGNGRIIVLSQDYFNSDTLNVKGTHVQIENYSDEYLDVHTYGIPVEDETP